MKDDAFEQLYEHHAEGLYAFIVYRTGDRGLAEDVVSETFERALRARKRYDPRKSKAKTWLYSIALNCARDHGRRRGAEERALERIAAGGERESLPYDAVDEREALTRAMQTLSEEEREVVALRYGADLTVPEMAKLLEQPLTTVEGRVYRGLRKLRDELG